MDFFEHQDDARRKTGRLVLLFVLAVVAITVLVYFAALGVFGYVATRTDGTAPSLFQLDLFLATTAAVAGVVTLGSLYKISLLRGGGRVVAESMGGERVEPGAATPRERVLLNVVEEMALASGTPVPPVYVMRDEAGINAFAAGFQPSDAVIGVTDGCVQRLSRDELQGVIAHEFSHIVHGDMRLNLRLMGVVHGILVIGLIGQFVFRSSFYTGGLRRRRGREGGSGVPIIVFGVALAAIGWIGTVFGNLIKAAVSRQREFLADASAVQFTRNPGGVSGALKKIGGLSRGSRLLRPNAAEVSHMLFGMGMRRGFTNVFATHPPLDERIRRIDPRFDGTFPRLADDFESPFVGDGPYAAAADAPVGRRVHDEARAQREAEEAARIERDAALRHIGDPTPEHLEYVRQLVDAIPDALRTAVSEPYGARAVVYALLLDRDAEVRARQLAALEEAADPAVFAETKALLAPLDELDRNARLPLIDLALPGLRELSPAQYRVFAANVVALIRADERVEPFEWVLQRLLLRHLAPGFGSASRKPVQYYRLQRLAQPCSVLLSTLARMGHGDGEAGVAAFAAGARHLEGATLEWLPRDRCSLGELGSALDALELVAHPLRRNLLMACGATIAHDHEVTVLEGEVFRAIADSLGCPIPPLLPGQPLV